MTRLDEGDQAANLLSQLLHTIGLGISDDPMPRELDDVRPSPRLNPVVWD